MVSLEGSGPGGNTSGWNEGAKREQIGRVHSLFAYIPGLEAINSARRQGTVVADFVDRAKTAVIALLTLPWERECPETTLRLNFTGNCEKFQSGHT